MPTKQAVWVTGGSWRSPGNSDVDAGVSNPAASWPFDVDNPALLMPGESSQDGRPAGVTVLDADALTASDEFRDIMLAAEAATPGGSSSYVDLGSRLSWISRLYDANTSGLPNWIGYVNSSRKVMGFFSSGGMAKIRPRATMVSATPAARGYDPASYVMDPYNLGGGAWAPIPVSALYFSNSGVLTPLFISGVKFQGTLQTPYDVVSAKSTEKVTRNTTTPSPLPYRGMQVWATEPGSRIQFCEFEGFGYALQNAPPYETGVIESNRGVETVRRCHIDGRIAAEIDPTRPLSSGGLMWNKSLSTTFEDSYLHHTRRSGWASNTNTRDVAERYYGKRVRVADLSDYTGDNFVGDSYSFAPSNIEEVIGIFDYQDVWLNADSSQHHINLAVPFGAGGSAANEIVIPDRPLVTLRGFYTNDLQYGGCLRIRVLKTPNSTGTSPVWTKVNALGIAGSNVFDIKNTSGQPMVGVRHSSYNAALHKPNTHFIVNY